MNIYEKLQNVRCELQKRTFKKSGKNAYAGYEYFELSDFLPTINELMLEHKLTTSVSFNSEIATLTLINIEKPEETIIFTSPMSSASLKGCHDVQNLGAVQTYLRRYLYVNAFEIVEHDPLDKTAGKQEEKTKIFQTELSDGQIKRCYAIAKEVGKNEESIKKWIKAKYNKESLKELNKKEYDELCKALERAKEP
jgi:hypothetical protein